MQNVLQKAAAGNRKAMEYLYDYTKQKVFYIAKLLLEDESLAESATIWTYRFGWSEIKTLELTTEDEFEKFMVQRVVGYCKKKTMKKNSKAFHVPANRNFNLNITQPIEHKGNSIEDVVLAQFTDLQRYIYILHTVAQYERKEIEKVVNLKIHILDLAMEVEKKNVEQILNFMGISELTNYQNVTLQIAETEKAYKVPERVDDEVKKVIGYIVEPIEKRQKKQRNLIISTIILVCVFLIGVGILFSSDEAANDIVGTEITAEEDEILTE